MPLGARISNPPAMVPSNIPRKVPASIRALPSTSSPVASSSGKIAYLTGPKNVACTPSRNNIASWKPIWPKASDSAASSMMPISASLTD